MTKYTAFFRLGFSSCFVSVVLGMRIQAWFEEIPKQNKTRKQTPERLAFSQQYTRVLPQKRASNSSKDTPFPKANHHKALEPYLVNSFFSIFNIARYVCFIRNYQSSCLSLQIFCINYKKVHP